MAERVKYNWAVDHPDYGVARVAACTLEEATLEAAQRWGVKWTEIARDCTAQKGGKAIAPKCRRCGGETAGGDLCMDCRKLLDHARREDAALRGRDRRARHEKR